MSRIGVFGVGSPFGDDQVGWKVVDWLRSNQKLESFISDQLWIEKYDRPQVSLLEVIQQFDIVFLMDAMRSNLPLGTIQSFSVDEIIHHDILLSTHGIGVSQMLSLGKVLNQLPDMVQIFGVEIEKIEGDSISPEVEIASQQLAKQLETQLLQKLFG